jgi:cytochrome c nitrite reductase small subunit
VLSKTKTILVAVFTLKGLPWTMFILIYVLVGIVIGIAFLLARVSNFTSYFSDAPSTCINCHVMTDAYASWQRGSHGRVAACTDCHLPHTNLVSNLAFKSKDGLKHSYVFTMRKEPQVLKLSNMARPVIQENCFRCHGEQFTMIRLAKSSERACWDCHQNIHGKVRSLSASPEILRPDLPGAGLDWIKKGNSDE